VLRGKARLAGMAGLLVGGGVLLGALASSATTDAWVWQPPPQLPVTDAPVSTPVDQARAGEGWARTAFDGGLRECPKMNAEFLAACETEMKKLAARPEFAAGSYRGPLLITKIVSGQSDDGWEAQERLEHPREQFRQAGYAAGPDPVPEEPALEPTPDNYPAASEDITPIPDDASRPIPRRPN